MSSIKPLKLGVRFDPPALVLVYLEETSKKLHCRTIPTRNIDILTDINGYAKKFMLNDKYKKYFSQVREKKLEKLLFILQDHMKGYSVKESLKRLDTKAKTAKNKLDDDDEDDDIDVDDLVELNKEKIQTYKNDDDDDDFSF